MSLFNQYSYLFLGAAALVLIFLAMRFAVRARAGVIILVQLAVAGLLLAGLLALRPGSSDVSGVEQAETLLRNGKPTFMEFFSNFCAGCLAVKPTVDQIVEAIRDDFNILRVDIHTTFGRALREQMGFSYTPEFILFDSGGHEVWRGHAPPSDERLDSLRAPGQ